MAYKIGNGVFETTTISGTGDYTLDGKETGFRAFSEELNDGDTCTVRVWDDTAFELLEVTWQSSGNKLVRGTVISGTSEPSHHNWSGTNAKNITLVVDGAKLQDLVDPTDQSTGLLVRTAANTYVGKEIAVTAAGGITVTNGDGVAGNPTLSIDESDDRTWGGTATFNDQVTFAAADTTFSTSAIKLDASPFRIDAPNGSGLRLDENSPNDTTLSLAVGGAFEPVVTNALLPTSSLTANEAVVVNTGGTAYTTQESRLPALVAEASLPAASFDVTLSSDYSMFEVEFVNVRPATDNQDFWMQVSIDGGSTYMNSGEYEYVDVLQNNNNQSNAVSAANQFVLGPLSLDNTASGERGFLSGKMWIYSVGDATEVFNFHADFVQRGQGSTSITHGTNSGTITDSSQTAAVDSIRFKAASGNLQSGTIRVWGIR